MLNIDDKVNGVSRLSATEFNMLKNMLKEIMIRSGDNRDSEGKVELVSAIDDLIKQPLYRNVGTANDLILTRGGAIGDIENLSPDMFVMFTSESLSSGPMTIKVNGLEVKPLKLAGNAIPVDYVMPNVLYGCQYNSTDDVFNVYKLGGLAGANYVTLEQKAPIIYTGETGWNKIIQPKGLFKVSDTPLKMIEITVPKIAGDIYFDYEGHYDVGDRTDRFSGKVYLKYTGTPTPTYGVTLTKATSGTVVNTTNDIVKVISKVELTEDTDVLRVYLSIVTDTVLTSLMVDVNNIWINGDIVIDDWLTKNSIDVVDTVNGTSKQITTLRYNERNLDLVQNGTITGTNNLGFERATDGIHTLYVPDSLATAYLLDQRGKEVTTISNVGGTGRSGQSVYGEHFALMNSANNLIRIYDFNSNVVGELSTVGITVKGMGILPDNNFVLFDVVNQQFLRYTFTDDLVNLTLTQIGTHGYVAQWGVHDILVRNGTSLLVSHASNWKFEELDLTFTMLQSNATIPIGIDVTKPISGFAVTDKHIIIGSPNSVGGSGSLTVWDINIFNTLLHRVDVTDTSSTYGVSVSGNDEFIVVGDDYLGTPIKGKVYLYDAVTFEELVVLSKDILSFGRQVTLTDYLLTVGSPSNHTIYKYGIPTSSQSLLSDGSVKMKEWYEAKEDNDVPTYKDVKVLKNNNVYHSCTLPIKDTIIVSAVYGNMELTLPDINNRTLLIKRIDDSVNTVTVVSNVDGETNKTLKHNDSISVIKIDGVWRSLAPIGSGYVGENAVSEIIVIDVIADTLALDLTLTEVYEMTMINSTVVSSIVDAPPGYRGSLVVKQDRVGGYHLAFGTGFKHPSNMENIDIRKSMINIFDYLVDSDGSALVTHKDTVVGEYGLIITWTSQPTPPTLTFTGDVEYSNDGGITYHELLTGGAIPTGTGGYILRGVDISDVNSLSSLETTTDLTLSGGYTLTTMHSMFVNMTSVTTPPDTSNFDTSNVTNMSYMFSGMSSLTTPPDVANWDTSSVTTMRDMFVNVSSVTTPPDTSNFDTSNVTTLHRMFVNMTSLITPPDVANWDTSSVTNMRDMFVNMTSLITPPDVANWGTSSVTTMHSMFGGMSSVTTPPDVANWGTSSVTTLHRMFVNMTSLITPPDVANWGTSSVTNMSYMFSGMPSVTTPPDVSNFDTSSVTGMHSMFGGMSSVTTPPDVANWGTSSVTTTGYMFSGMSSLITPPDVANWDTSSVTIMNYVFSGMSSLTTPPDVSNFDTSSVITIHGMFSNLSSLVIGLIGIENFDVTSLTYAADFLLGSSLTTEAYDTILVNWSQQVVQLNVPIHFGNSNYTLGGEAEAARDILINKGWTITDSGGI